MKCIILATDFTELSQRALEAAHDLSRRLSLPLHLVHVVEPIEEPDQADTDTRQFHQQLEERALRKLEEAGKPLGGNVTWSVALGHRARELVSLAQEREALLVMGSPKLGADHMPWVGTSQRVVWQTRQPVLLVP